MGTAWSYNSDPCDEHDAIREAAGLLDMSGLKKVHVKGTDAEHVVDHIITRDMSKIGPGQSAYGPILTDQGTVCDDAIIYNMGENEYLVVHGGGETMERLQESANGKNASLEFDDDLHDISLQGPKALELLNPNTPIDLPDMKYFHHTKTEVFGHTCILSRTGYSGERGYEIFAGANVICDMWDNILGHGKEMGIMPCSFTSLDKARVEAALLFYGYDMTTEHTPWEVGLGWAVNPDKADYRGKAAALAAKGQERFLFSGIVADLDDMLAGGEKLMLDGEDVGVVNSPAYSHRMKKSLALVHLHPKAVVENTKLDVVGDGMSCIATVAQIPFYDPEKTRTHQ
jgi:aminomethyltransferase